ncbi:MAG: 4-phosphoerythronate dehydrogenase [Bacteroidales bacterium]|nr:4-phosphoerythronate dehydrogenase [Bacteroidales bacterium]
MKIVVDKDIPFIKGILEPFADVEYLPGNGILNHNLIDADALLIRTRTLCNGELLDQTNVRFIGTATIGYDHIDIAYCDANRIVWRNAPGCNAGSVNQYIASSLVQLAKRHGFSLRDRAFGVVGVGHVGSRVVHTAELLGMHVYLCDPPRVEKEGICGFIDLEGILRESDIITFHVPLQAGKVYNTHHMIGTKLLERTNPGTFIINTSRGPVGDTGALKSALKSGRIRGLVADVWEDEPDIDGDLLSMADIATPHIAGYSADGKANGTAMIVQEASRFFNLGLNQWRPEDIPPPGHPEININCRGHTEEEILSEAILGSYDVLEDDQQLRRSPVDFEKLRSGYPVRREFNSYILKLSASWTSIERRCRRMGFRVST